MRKKSIYLWGWGILGLIVVGWAIFWLVSRMDWQSFGRLDKMDQLTYLNQVVERVNTMLSRMEESFQSYTFSIPAEVTEETEIEISKMRKDFLSVDQYLPRVAEIETLKSRDLELQQQILNLYPDYYQAIRDYLTLYSEVIGFYRPADFKGLPDKVAEYDVSLKKVYYHFIQEHNHLTTFLNAVGENF